MNGNAIEKDFPNLRHSGYLIASESTPEYNCIAWAVGDTEKWWWPSELYYWPPGISQDTSLQAFIEAFKTLGHEPCDSYDLEPGYEKVAIYVNEDNDPTHAARQLDSGKWTSKLGSEEDIEHELDGLVGEEYGSVAIILKRPLSVD